MLRFSFEIEKFLMEAWETFDEINNESFELKLLTKNHWRKFWKLFI